MTKTSKKKSPAGVARKAKPKAKRSVTQKARAVMDDQLASLSPALKQKLEEVKNQIPVGDLRSLGMNVLERARALSEMLKNQASLRPAMQKAKSRVSKAKKK